MKRMLLSLVLLSLSACGVPSNQADVAQAFGVGGVPPPSDVGGPCGRDNRHCKTGLICEMPPVVGVHIGTCVAPPAPDPSGPTPCDVDTGEGCPVGTRCVAVDPANGPKGQCRPDDPGPVGSSQP